MGEGRSRVRDCDDMECVCIKLLVQTKLWDIGLTHPLSTFSVELRVDGAVERETETLQTIKPLYL